MEFHRVSRKIPQVPIIPLIDILAILLIYFAVAYDPKIERHTMPIERAVAQDVMTFKVSGQTSVLAIAKDGTVTLDAQVVPNTLLGQYLRVFKESYPDRKLELEPDAGLPIGEFIRVQQALLEAGIRAKDVPARVKLPSDSPAE